MGTTLAHGAAGGRRFRLRTAARLAVALAVLAVLAAREGDGDPLLPEPLRALEPARPGEYRMVGTERDSRTGRATGTEEAYTVEPWFTAGGVKHQVTRFGDGGEAGERETAFRADGAHRVRESAGGVSWWWEPPLRTVAAPLAVGASWTARSTASVPDAAGFRRVTEVESTTEVVGATTVEVAGRRVRAYVLHDTTATTVTTTRRADRAVTTTTFTSRGRSWFSPRHMLVVRSHRTTTVEGDPTAAGPYEVARRSELARLEPA
ncbi:MAG: hypothetical protein ACLGIO_05950 [Acidimicrobiia bacterium]